MSRWLPLLRIYLAMLGLLVVCGLMWAAGNVGYVPKYGDSNEYLQYAEILKVDHYRTILYPALIRLFGVTSMAAYSPHTEALFGFQFLVSFVSFCLFGAALLNGLGTPAISLCLRRWIVATVAMACAGLPLLAHFSLSLMSDSLACSLTLASIGVLAGLVTEYRERGLCWKRLLLCWFLLFAMSLSRVDRLFLGVMLVVIVVTWLWRIGKRAGNPHVIRDCALLLVVLGSSLAATIGTNHLTQTYDSGRPRLVFTNMAFNRIVWPRLHEVYPYLSVRARNMISLDEAEHFDAHNNNVFPLMVKILDENADGRHVIDDITLETLRRFPLEVFSKAVFDEVKYVFPGVAFPLELFSVIPESVGTSWTYSRMTMFDAGPTKLWLALSFLCFFAVQMPIFLYPKGRRLTRFSIGKPAFVLSIATIVFLAFLFVIESGVDSNIRYSLVPLSMEFEIVTMIGLISLLPGGMSDGIDKLALGKWCGISSG
jgi:hypothetical protein